MSDLPFDYGDPDRPAMGATPRCRRHEWTWIGDTPEQGERCRWCHHVRDVQLARANRNNRKRGNRTSHDLAAYLGGRDVEPLKLPWDVEGKGFRIQSKRLADEPSLAAIARIVRAIDAPADTMRAFYHVLPRQRLANGTVWVLAPEWVAWHGWAMSRDMQLASWASREGAVFISMPLSLFRELHVGEVA